MDCMCYYSAPTEQIQAAVMVGQRPDLEDISGPEHFEVFTKTCVQKCWDGEPEHRPTFGGEIYIHT